MQFTDFPLDHRIQKTLLAKGFTTPTDIQAQALGHALLGKDLMASSKTGSGKTLAFLIPALQRVLKTKPLSRKDPRVLILAPTRELAKQVFLQLKWLISGHSLSAVLILGGENFNDQVKALRRNPQFVVGTAGRIADHIKDKSLYLNGLELLILDEADRMLDLGFKAQLTMINRFADHRKRQTMMFSATLDSAQLHDITGQLLKSPQRIRIGDANEKHEDIAQQFFFADHLSHKKQLLNALVKQAQDKQVIVFTATREDTETLSNEMHENNYDSIALSAELTQSQRSNIMNAFSRGQHQILVTTDVASRGLDLLNVGLVVNFDLPKSSEEYIHRIGRTGRAGQQGQAISLVGPKDWNSFVAIKALLNQHIEMSEVAELPAKFSGIKAPAKIKKATSATSVKPVKHKQQPAAPRKRIRTTDGIDVGHVAVKRKKRIVPEE